MCVYPSSPWTLAETPPLTVVHDLLESVSNFLQIRWSHDIFLGHVIPLGSSLKLLFMCLCSVPPEPPQIRRDTKPGRGPGSNASPIRGNWPDLGLLTHLCRPTGLEEIPPTVDCPTETQRKTNNTTDLYVWSQTSFLIVNDVCFIIVTGPNHSTLDRVSLQNTLFTWQTRKTTHGWRVRPRAAPHVTR